MSGQIGRKAVAVQHFAIALDDGVGDQRRYQPGDQHEKQDAEAFKLSLGFLREKLLHPNGKHLHEHNVPAAKEQQPAQ